ncbi:MAG: hypothetical protein WC997_01880 [Porticoccaceae bacterium]
MKAFALVGRGGELFKGIQAFDQLRFEHFVRCRRESTRTKRMRQYKSGYWAMIVSTSVKGAA